MVAAILFKQQLASPKQQHHLQKNKKLFLKHKLLNILIDWKNNLGVAPLNTGVAVLFAAIFFCRNTGAKKGFPLQSLTQCIVTAK